MIILVGAVVYGALSSRRPTVNVPVEVSGRPAIKVDQTRIDMGDVKLGKTVEATFQVSNVGDQPLRISSAPTIKVLEGC